MKNVRFLVAFMALLVVVPTQSAYRDSLLRYFAGVSMGWINAYVLFGMQTPGETPEQRQLRRMREESDLRLVDLRARLARQESQHASSAYTTAPAPTDNLSTARHQIDRTASPQYIMHPDTTAITTPASSNTALWYAAAAGLGAAGIYGAYKAWQYMDQREKDLALRQHLSALTSEQLQRESEKTVEKIDEIRKSLYTAIALKKKISWYRSWERYQAVSKDITALKSALQEEENKLATLRIARNERILAHTGDQTTPGETEERTAAASPEKERAELFSTPLQKLLDQPGQSCTLPTERPTAHSREVIKAKYAPMSDEQIDEHLGKEKIRKIQAEKAARSYKFRDF